MGKGLEGDVRVCDSFVYCVHLLGLRHLVVLDVLKMNDPTLLLRALALIVGRLLDVHLNGAPQC